MLFVSRVLLLVCLSILLANCARLRNADFIEHRDKQYLRAYSIAPLRIPPGLSSEAFSDYYPVSARAYPGNKDVSIVPPGLYDA